MRAQMGALLQAGLALKLNQLKRATTSYVRDRSDQGQNAVISYAVAAGLYAAAGIFAIALLLVGVAALFRWVELNYGLFQAFGAIAAVLLVLAIICAALATSRLKRKARPVISLASRLRVAIRANPIRLDAANGARDTGVTATSPGAAATLRPPTATQSPRALAQPSPGTKAGLVVAATLMGWALARRRSLGRQATARPAGPLAKADV